MIADRLLAHKPSRRPGTQSQILQGPSIADPPMPKRDWRDQKPKKNLGIIQEENVQKLDTRKVLRQDASRKEDP